MDPFRILNITEDITQTELDDTYKSLKAKYSEQRFLPGDAGANACKRLSEIEEAYHKASDFIADRYTIDGNRFQRVEDAIKQDNLDFAQNLLDNTINRDGEWYYYQAIVFFKKNWHQEAIKQLELAITLDPENAKYRDSLKELKNVVFFGQNQRENENKSFYGQGEGSNGHTGRSYKDTNVDGMPRPIGCSPCMVCQGLICADCCCECLGGDLISCC